MNDEIAEAMEEVREAWGEFQTALSKATKSTLQVKAARTRLMLGRETLRALQNDKLAFPHL